MPSKPQTHENLGKLIQIQRAIVSQWVLLCKSSIVLLLAFNGTIKKFKFISLRLVCWPV